MGRQSLGRGFAAAVVSFAVALGACASGGDDPGASGSGSPLESSAPAGGLDDPTVDPSPELSVEPTDAGPPLLVWEPAPSKPAELAEWNEVGAEAFVHYAIDVLNYTQKFNDTDTLRGISDDYCGFCADTIERFDHWRDSEFRMTGGELAFDVENIGYQDASGLYYFDGVLSVVGSRIYVQDVLDSEGEPYEMDATLVVGLEGGEWYLFELGGHTRG